MYSIDLSERYYHDTDKKTGYVIDELKSAEEPEKYAYHTLLTGNVLPAFLDTIGDNIDFLILDTMHILPGEILDFLAAFHHLSKNAIVVLHDVSLAYEDWAFVNEITGNLLSGKTCIATSVLFQSVTADKFLNNAIQYPNIATFRINEDTEKYILDVFTSLIIPWAIMPDDEQLKLYGNVFLKEYGEEAFLLWNQAKELSAERLCKKADLAKMHIRCIGRALNDKRVLVYGAGQRAKELFNCLKLTSAEVAAFVVSDGQSKPDTCCGKPVYFYSDIPKEYDDCVIVQAVFSYQVESVLSTQNKYEHVCLPNRIWQTLRGFSFEELFG